MRFVAEEITSVIYAQIYISKCLHVDYWTFYLSSKGQNANKMELSEKEKELLKMKIIIASVSYILLCNK